MCNEKSRDLNQDLLDKLKSIESDPVEQEKAYQRMKNALDVRFNETEEERTRKEIEHWNRIEHRRYTI